MGEERDGSLRIRGGGRGFGGEKLRDVAFSRWLEEPLESLYKTRNHNAPGNYSQRKLKEIIQIRG